MKTLKFYETPAVEIVDLEVENMILAGSGNAEGIDDPTPGDDDFDLDD